MLGNIRAGGHAAHRLFGTHRISVFIFIPYGIGSVVVHNPARNQFNVRGNGRFKVVEHALVIPAGKRIGFSCGVVRRLHRRLAGQHILRSRRRASAVGVECDRVGQRGKVGVKHEIARGHRIGSGEIYAVAANGCREPAVKHIARGRRRCAGVLQLRLILHADIVSPLRAVAPIAEDIAVARIVEIDRCCITIDLHTARSRCEPSESFGA